MSDKKIIKEVEEQYLNSLKISRRKSKKPVVMAMVGLVGSGNSSVAKALGPSIGATIIEANHIRVLLRKRKQGYESVGNISKKALVMVLKKGGNAILDSDFVDSKKRKNFEQKIKKTGAKIVYLRTFCDRDILIGRLLNAKYTLNDLYGGASANWNGKNKPAVVAIREMWRRTPWHYRWSEGGGGRFLLKKLRIPFLAEIDTGGDWKKKIPSITKKIKAL